MLQAEQQRKEFEALARPLMEWLGCKPSVWFVFLIVSK